MLSILWEWMLKGDGNRQSRKCGSKQTTYYTSSKKLANNIQELLQKIGKDGSITTCKPSSHKSYIKGREIKSKSIIYKIYQRDSKLRAMNGQKVFYKGYIYCVSIPNGLVYVRRNGKPIWSGNSPVFVVATANDNQSIPSEFLRAGRFDEIFFVDLPNNDERKEIFEVLLRLRNYKAKDFDLDLLANSSKDYSGAEIEKSIDQAMLDGFCDKQRKIVTKDIAVQFGRFKSLFELRKDDFVELREWANEKCVKANSEEKKTESVGIKGQRSLDLEVEQETTNDGGIGGKRKIDLE